MFRKLSVAYGTLICVVNNLYIRKSVVKSRVVMEFGDGGGVESRLSIVEMAQKLISAEPGSWQLQQFIEFIGGADDPLQASRELFSAYLAAQSGAGYSSGAADLIIPAQSYLKGYRVGQPLDSKHQELFYSPESFHEALVALRSLRDRCHRRPEN